jgi:hypothetical protein
VVLLHAPFQRLSHMELAERRGDAQTPGEEGAAWG